MRQRGLVALVLASALSGAVGVAIAQESSSEIEAGRHWLRLMNHTGDTDTTISKKEFDTYINAEFDKADLDHDGKLTVGELGRLHAALEK